MIPLTLILRSLLNRCWSKPGRDRRSHTAGDMNLCLVLQTCRAACHGHLVTNCRVHPRGVRNRMDIRTIRNLISVHDISKLRQIRSSRNTVVIWRHVGQLIGTTNRDYSTSTTPRLGLRFSEQLLNKQAGRRQARPTRYDYTITVKKPFCICPSTAYCM